MADYKRIKKKIYGHSVEHRIIMERHLKRKLNSEEVVHHINGDKADNRIKNLQLLPNRAVHNSLHAGDFCPKGHRYTKENTLIKRNRNQNPYRRCRICHRLTANLKPLNKKIKSREPLSD
jgi:HNH endonuclease